MNDISEEDVRLQLLNTGQEIQDENGHVIGFVACPASFKVARPYLAAGGFLVVTRDEDSGLYIGTEFDALKNPKTKQYYPAGHSERAWTTASFNEAFQLVMAALRHLDVE